MQSLNRGWSKLITPRPFKWTLQRMNKLSILCSKIHSILSSCQLSNAAKKNGRFVMKKNSRNKLPACISEWLQRSIVKGSGSTRKWSCRNSRTMASSVFIQRMLKVKILICILKYRRRLTTFSDHQLEPYLPKKLLLLKRKKQRKKRKRLRKSGRVKIKNKRSAPTMRTSRTGKKAVHKPRKMQWLSTLKK